MKMARTPAAPARRERARIPEMDLFRVLLVFIVSWYHIWQQSWLTPYIGETSLDFLVRSGYMEVDGTILLSGFLLFLPWAKARLDGTPIPSTRNFYRRRIARIVPSFTFFVLLMLFAVALPQGQYGSSAFLRRDVIAHLTYTFNLRYDTYLLSPLGGGAWTIAVEMQMYLLFPLLAWLAVRKPGATLLGMAAAAALFRGWAVWRYSEYNMVVNQLISFQDVYALGMALAMVYVRLKKSFDEKGERWWQALLFTLIAAAGLWLTVRILKDQAGSPSYPAIQSGQMIRRPALAIALGMILIGLPFMFRPFRLDAVNPVRRFLARVFDAVFHFLSMISMNYYLLHQPLAVQLKHYRIPDSIYESPNVAGDTAWQYPYVALCFGLSLLAATIVTFGVEKPCAALLNRLYRRSDRRREKRRLRRGMRRAVQKL